MEEQFYETVYKAATDLFRAEWLKRRSFSAEFQNAWHQLLRTNVRADRSYLPENTDSVFPVAHTFEGGSITFHFDQGKLADWFQQDSKGKAHRVFLPQDLRREPEGIFYKTSPFHYDPQASEPSVPEGKLVLVCSLPGFPPPLQAVYGNRNVERSFRGLGKRKLLTFLIPAEFTPAFLCTSFEVCLYLFWMDCCILKENQEKLSDADIQPLLHIFRPSSMLTIRGLK
jgi:hypothetical protein